MQFCLTKVRIKSAANGGRASSFNFPNPSFDFQLPLNDFHGNGAKAGINRNRIDATVAISDGQNVSRQSRLAGDIFKTKSFAVKAGAAVIFTATAAPPALARELRHLIYSGSLMLKPV